MTTENQEAVEPSKEELQELRDEGLTRDEIAAIYETSTSQVKRWLADYKIVKTITQPNMNLIPAATENLNWDAGMPVMERCKFRLGERMTEDSRGYRLDGRPTSSKDLILAAGLPLADRALS